MDLFFGNNEAPQNKVAIVSAKESFSILGIKKKLQEAGIEGIPVKPSVFQIENAINSDEPIIYYLDDDIYTPRGEEFLRDLSTLCLEEGRLVILVGENAEYYNAIKIIPASAIVAWFARPVDMDALLDTVKSAIHGEITPARKHHILIIDDDPTYMRMLNEWMKDRYHITMLDSGTKAIHWLMENKDDVDLILLDYEMPIMNGSDVFLMLKRDQTLRDIPVMFLTGKDDRDIVMKIVEMRPVDYILKSIDKLNLMNKLEDFFAQGKDK